MMYPRKTPKQAKEDEEAKKLLSLKQREQLKSLMSTKLQNKYPEKDQESLQEKVERFFEQKQTLTADNLRELDRNVGLSEKSAQLGDRDDMSVKSGVSKMSGATDFLSPDNLDDLKTKKGATMIDIGFKTNKAPAKKYKNDEEEWADIYTYNNEVYKAEAQIEEERRAFDKVKYRSELDDQVVIKQYKKADEEAFTKQADIDMVKAKVYREELKDLKKADVMKAKTELEKVMRDKQIKQNVAQRKAEVREQKQLDRYIVQRIREEQIEDERYAKKKRSEELANYRKMLLDNEEKRKILNEEREKERQAENRQIKEYNRMVEAREKQRADELKAKDVKTRQTILAAKGLVGKPSNERERIQDMKVRRWAEKKEREDKEAEIREKEEALKKKVDTRFYLTEQMVEKNARKVELKKETDEQAKYWVESADQYNIWQKQKEEEKKNQMKVYAETLKKQMNEKFEERRITDRLFDLRATLNENKISS